MRHVHHRYRATVTHRDDELNAIAGLLGAVIFLAAIVLWWLA
jgi:hypothetical protein